MCVYIYKIDGKILEEKCTKRNGIPRIVRVQTRTCTFAQSDEHHIEIG